MNNSKFKTNNQLHNSKIKMGSGVGQGIEMFKHRSYPKSFSHTFYLLDILESPEEMINFVEILKSSTVEDDITVVINTDGGDITSAMMLYEAIKKSETSVHGYCVGKVCSAGTVVMLACDNIEIADFCSFLFHNASWHVSGDMAHIKSYNDHNYDLCKDWMTTLYKDILTEEELTDMFKGVQVYLHSHVMSERLKKLKTNDELSEEDIYNNITRNDIKHLTKNDLIKLLLGESQYDLDTKELIDIERTNS